MNPSWKNFLLSEQAIFENGADIVCPSPEHEGEQCIYPIAHLGVLAVAGVDAANFLQGQITCNINDVSDMRSSLGAMCTPKGRVISTFLLVKNGDGFLMILPQELLASVKKRLQMYVLRSNVTLTDCSDELCLVGLSFGASQFGEALGFATDRQENIVVNLQNRCLVIAEADKAQAVWQQQVKQGVKPGSLAQWRYFDIISGMPWLSLETSEEFIPQMLNLDKLGGISFNKGCYTGQEIVARTHYLGKAKREMFLAECDALAPPEPNSTIIDDSAGTEQSAGKVLYAQKNQQSCKMLVVLQVSDTNTYNLKLDNDEQDKVTLLNRQQ